MDAVDQGIARDEAIEIVDRHTRLGGIGVVKRGARSAVDALIAWGWTPPPSPAEQNDETERDELLLILQTGSPRREEMADSILALFRRSSPAATTREETVPASTNNESDDEAKPERKHEGHGLCGLLEVNGHQETAETVHCVLFPVPKGDE